MRVIAVGCEYSGVSTLIEQVHQWGLSRGISHHLDDHSNSSRPSSAAPSPISAPATPPRGF